LDVSESHLLDRGETKQLHDLGSDAAITTSLDGGIKKDDAVVAISISFVVVVDRGRSGR
jgi:hypothetical protein